MPRLDLVGDDGRVLFSGQVAQKHVDQVARWLKNNMATLQTIANGKRAIDDLVEAAQRVLGAVNPPPVRRLRGRR